MEKPARFPYQFFSVTFAWTWLLWLPLVLARFGSLPLGPDLVNKLIAPVTILAGAGPAAGALFCLRTINGKGAGLRYLRSFLDLRFGWKMWLALIIVPGGVVFLAWILPELWGAPRLNSETTFCSFLFYLLFISPFLGGGEEIGWRGYILDPLEQRLGPWLGNLVLGIIWGVWHLPLFFVPGTNQALMPFIAFLMGTIGLSYILSWVRQASGKRPLSGVIAHGWGNAFTLIFPVVLMSAGGDQPRFWLWGIISLAVGLIIMIIRSRSANNRRTGPQ
jgi:uncharacterized protein